MTVHDRGDRRWGGRLAVLAMLALLAAQATAELNRRQDKPSAGGSTTTRPASFGHALLLPIEGEITKVTDDSIGRRLKQAAEQDLELVIFELNTPGGAGGPMLDICKRIKKLRDSGVYTYAWINDEAYSAGTIIALATDGIVMAPNATIGDCQPIMITGAGASAVPDDIEAKITSPILEELEDSIRRNGYNYDMVLSFVRPEIQMFWVVNTETREKRFVTRHERDRLFELPEAEDERSADDEGSDDKKTRTRSRPEPIPDSESTTAWKYVQEAPGLGPIRQPVVTDRNLLTMRTDKAAAFGFSLGTVGSESELPEFFNITGAVERLESSFVESAIEWLASPIVRGVLFLLMILGAYAEFQTPGFGLAGSVALVALVIFLGAPYLAGYTVTWEIVLIILGVVLLLVEVFVIPGFGVAGILGIILLVVGLLASFVPAEPFPGGGDWPRLPSLPLTWLYVKKATFSLAGGLAGSIVGMFFLAKYLPKMPVAGRIIAPNPTPEQVMMDDPYDGAAKVGDIGRAESTLRPAGKARFGAMLVDVVAEGEYIDRGRRIEVIDRRGNRVVVRRID